MTLFHSLTAYTIGRPQVGTSHSPCQVSSLQDQPTSKTGMANASTDLNAYQYMLEAKYKAGKTTLTAGFESLSATDQASEEKDKSFFPLYGTNSTATWITFMSATLPIM